MTPSWPHTGVKEKGSQLQSTNRSSRLSCCSSSSLKVVVVVTVAVTVVVVAKVVVLFVLLSLGWGAAVVVLDVEGIVEVESMSSTPAEVIGTVVVDWVTASVRDEGAGSVVEVESASSIIPEPSRVGSVDAEYGMLVGRLDTTEVLALVLSPSVDGIERGIVIVVVVELIDVDTVVATVVAMAAVLFVGLMPWGVELGSCGVSGWPESSPSRPELSSSPDSSCESADSGLDSSPE